MLIVHRVKYLHGIYIHTHMHVYIYDIYIYIWREKLKDKKVHTFQLVYELFHKALPWKRNFICLYHLLFVFLPKRNIIVVCPSTVECTNVKIMKILIFVNWDFSTFLSFGIRTALILDILFLYRSKFRKPRYELKCTFSDRFAIWTLRIIV